MTLDKFILEVKKILSEGNLQLACDRIKYIANEHDYVIIRDRLAQYNNHIIEGLNSEDIEVEYNSITKSMLLLLEKADVKNNYTQPPIFEIELAKIHTLLDEKNDSKAFALLNELSQYFPDNDDINFLLGYIYMGVGFNQEATMHYLKIGHSFHKYDLVLYNLGVIYRPKDKEKAFFYYFNAYLNQKPNRKIDYSLPLLFDVWFDTDLDFQKKIISKYLIEFPESGVLHAIKGYYLEYKLNNVIASIESYQKSLTLDPGLLKVYYFLADSYHQLNDQDNELKAINALVLKEGSIDAFISRSSIYWFRKDYKNAILDYTKILEMDGGKENTYQARAACYYHIQEYDLCEKDLASSISINGNSHSSYFSLSLLYHAKKDEQRAIETVSKAISLDNSIVKYFDFRQYLYSITGNILSQEFDLLNIVKLYVFNNIPPDNLLKETYFKLIPIMFERPITLPILVDVVEYGTKHFPNEYRFISFKSGILYLRKDFKNAMLTIEYVLNSYRIDAEDLFTYNMASKIYKELGLTQMCIWAIQKDTEQIQESTRKIVWNLQNHQKK